MIAAAIPVIFSFLSVDNASAQNNPIAIAAAVPILQSTVDVSHLDLELKQLRFDCLIAETSRALSNAVTSQDQWLLRYFRGSAYWNLGFLDEAEADMIAAGGNESVPDPKYPTPRAFLQTIARQKALRPVHRHDVTLDGVPMFTVFADDEDAALLEILDLLPVAVNSVKRLLGVTPHKTMILVFHDLARMRAYDDVPDKMAPMGCWAWAHACTSGVRVCPAGAMTTPAPDILGYYFRSTITHEYMHTAVARTLEGDTPMPVWLNEGVADVAGAFSAPAAETRHAWRFSQVLLHNAILPLLTMSGSDYYQETQNQYASGGLHDPYAQGHAMTTYLLLGRPRGIVMTLLQNMKATRNFEQAFAMTFGQSTDEFYSSWRNYVGQ